MNKKHLFVLILILVVLGVLVTLKQSHRPAELRQEEYAPLDLSFDPASVAKIILSKKDEASKVEIRKEKELWILPGFFNARANRDKIDTFFKEIREAKGEQRAQSKSVFKDFGITDEEALSVVLANAAGTEVLSFQIGAKRGDYGSVFVRRKNSEAVFLAQANLLSSAGIYGDLKTDNPKKEFWAALNFVSTDLAGALSLKITKIQNGKEIITVNLKRTAPGGSWQSLLSGAVPAGGASFPLNGDKIKVFLEGAKTWSAQEVLDPKAQDYGFAKPVWVLEAGLDGGASVKVTVSHPKEGPDYFAEVTGEPVVFKLPEYQVKAMETDESRFFTDDFFGVEVDKIEKLTLRADKKEMNFQPKLKKWDALVNYLNEFKNFHIEHLLFDPAEAKKAAAVRASIEIQRAGEGVKVLEIGEPLAPDNKEYAAQVRGTGQPFAIKEATYKQLFENLDRLKEPEPVSPEKPAAKS